MKKKILKLPPHPILIPNDSTPGRHSRHSAVSGHLLRGSFPTNVKQGYSRGVKNSEQVIYNILINTGCPKKKFIIEFLAFMGTRQPTSLSLLCCCAVLSSPLCAFSSFKANHYISIPTTTPCNLDCSSWMHSPMVHRTPQPTSEQ